MERYDDRPGRTGRLFPWLLLLGLGAFVVWRYWPTWTGTGFEPNATPRAVTARGDLAEDEKTTIAVFRESSHSVVHITTLAVRRDAISLDLQQIPRGTGSGFVWDKKGHIVTNYHVIQGADAARVTFADQSSFRATLVGAYPDKDLAVLSIAAPAERLRPIPLGSSADLQVGQKTFAIGNPFGLDRTLTTGVVSALGREIESVTRHTIKDMIQTDAAINPGNSGGPLLDSAGRLIGVNTAIFSPSGAYAGIGFAIPVDEVNRVIPQILKHGKVTRPVLGIQTAPDRVARQLGVKGVLIFDVIPESPAAKAGLRPTRKQDGQLELGDVILSVDDQAVRTLNELLDVLEKHSAGDEVLLKIVRDGKEEEVRVTLVASQ